MLVALLIGGKLLGLAGALLALPLTAGLRVLVEDLRPDLPGEPQGMATRVAAVEAAMLTTATAAQGQEGARATTGHVEVLVEERGGPSSAPPPHNPAR